jgi:hypothetical protein
MKAEFNKSFAAFAGDPALPEWKDQYRRGVTPRANDIAVMRQKSSLVPKLMSLRRVLFLFERVYYRLVDIRENVDATALGSALSTGGTAAEFYKELEADRGELEKKAAAFRFGLKLYAERNEGRDAVSLDSEDEEDFFEDTSSFFKN